MVLTSLIALPPFTPRVLYELATAQIHISDLIYIGNNQADGSAHKNNIFSNDIIAMRASQAVINGNTSSEDAKMNNMILSHEALKLFTVSGSSGFLGGGT